MVSCQKGPAHHAYAWQIGPYGQDTIDMLDSSSYLERSVKRIADEYEIVNHPDADKNMNHSLSTFDDSGN